MNLSPEARNWLNVAGRSLLALVFIISGLSKIPAWDVTLQYMASAGMPMPSLFLFPAIFIEVLGGLSILLGFRAKIGATALFLYMIPVTLIFHAFWSYGGMDRQMQLVNFLKNLAIMGGLLTVSIYGAGAKSLDHFLATRKTIPFDADKRRIRKVS